MGSSLFGGGTSKINSTTNSNSTSNANFGNTSASTSDPTAWQMPYLATGFNEADRLYKNAPGYTPLNRNSMSPETWGHLYDSNNFASGAMPYASGAMSTGSGVLSGALGGAGAAASSVADRASTDPTGANISAASKYADNPYTEGMITAAQRPIQRQLDEVSIPGLNSAANGSNNVDSSRAGTAEAILRRGAGEDMSDAASKILGTNYASGLNLAETGRTANNNALLGASGALSGLAGRGLDTLSTGNALGLTNAQVPITNAQLEQNDANAQNQNDWTNAQNQAMWPWTMLNNFWNIAGKPMGTNNTASTSGSQDTTSTGTNVTNGTQTQPGPGTLGGLLGIGTGIGSFFAPTGALGLGPSIASKIFG